MRSRVTPHPSASVLPKSDAASSLCASESLFSRLTRWSAEHQVNQSEMCRLLSVHSLEIPLLGPSTGLSCFASSATKPLNVAQLLLAGGEHPEMRKSRPVLQKLKVLLGMGSEALMNATGVLDWRSAAVFTSTTELRFCRECLKLGFHSLYFQYPGAMVCPYHQCRLERVCSSCAKTSSPTIRSVIESPMACLHCGYSWVMLNSSLRDEKRKLILSSIGPMIDNRMKEIAPLPRTLFGQHRAWWWPTTWSPASQASARPVQVRRWTLWNDSMTRCRTFHEQQVPLEVSKDPPICGDTDLSPKYGRGVRCEPTCSPVSKVTVDRADETLRWLSELCSSYTNSSLRIRGQMGMRPEGRCMNEPVYAVSVALFQTMITFGVQRSDACFLEKYERDWPHVYHDIRWNHLQFSREGTSQSAVDTSLIESEILSWFALALVRTAQVRYTLEIVWPWHLNPWQFAPPHKLVRDGTQWMVCYRSRATRHSIKRLIHRYAHRVLSPVHDHELRTALSMLRISMGVRGKEAYGVPV